MAGFLAPWNWVASAMLVFSTIAACYPTNYPQYRCATNAAPQNALNGLNTTALRVGNRPWGITYLNEYIAFAAVNFSIAVLDTTKFQPQVLSTIPFPEKAWGKMGNDDINSDGYGYREIALSHDKLNLYVATGYGAVIIDVVRAITGAKNPVVGYLTSGGFAGSSAIELSVTPDNKFVFISQEFGNANTYNRGAVEVFNVTRQDDGTVVSSWRGYIALPGFATVGQQFSPDHKKLFVTSELNSTTAALNRTSGVLSVLDVATLKYYPGNALFAKVSSGCRPVRCHMDGERLWVTQRDANKLSVFDVQKLVNNETDDALLATVNTGTSPIGVDSVGKYVFTADSNRFDYDNATTGVTVVDSTLALEGQVDFPQIPTGEFPRALAVSPSGNRLLISEFGSGNIRVVDVSSLNGS